MDSMWISGWNVIARTVLGGIVTYIVLIALLRVSGPRTLAKWYAFHLIVTVAWPDRGNMLPKSTNRTSARHLLRSSSLRAY